ncbi:carbohydrate kinase family protein [Streptomyces avicenniae]|uniref:carbohydrate kinase family protein n=1 Tax=Streptomyces avicenniae TaxID=500153 RepID=UPI000AA689DF|nr:carbohydrate kinase family protein [Streptomyces avicenniae]
MIDTTQPRYDVLVVGGSGVDTIVRVDELAVPGGDAVGVPPIRDYVAHTGTGAALGFHALGRRTQFIDFLGDDLQGAQVRERFAAAGVALDTLHAPNGTPRSVNLVDARGRRFSFYDGRHPADLLMPLDFALAHAIRARHVHVSRSHFNRELLGELAERGIPTSTDLHAWDGTDPAALPWALTPDAVFLSAAAAGERVGDVMRMILDEGRARVVVATDGERGAYVLDAAAGGTVRHHPAVVPPLPVVDSNGAGDAFLTAFLHSRLDGAPPDACALAGLVSGAFACTRHGTHERQITAAELAAAVSELNGLRPPSGPTTPADRPSPAGWRWS